MKKVFLSLLFMLTGTCIVAQIQEPVRFSVELKALSDSEMEIVDDKRPLPQPVKVKENGKEVILKTIGDKWSYLQRSKFGANAQPFYVLLDNEGKPLNKSYAYDEDIDSSVDFLRKGLDNYRR